MLLLPAVFLSAAVASSALAGSLPSLQSRVAPDAADCATAGRLIGWYEGTYNSECYPLIQRCINEAETSVYIWHKTSCVAAATCYGPESVWTLAACTNSAIPERASTLDLSTDVYSGIVDDCSDCSMTQQNYIDFFYGALSDVNSTSWPGSTQDVVDNFWGPLINWTATGDVVPYKNFDDFLHYSDNGP